MSALCTLINDQMSIIRDIVKQTNAAAHSTRHFQPLNAYSYSYVCIYVCIYCISFTGAYMDKQIHIHICSRLRAMYSGMVTTMEFLKSMPKCNKMYIC